MTPLTLTAQQADILLRHLQNPARLKASKYNAFRDHAMALLMLDAGLRVGELVQLLMSDLFFRGAPVNSISVRPEIAKGNRRREVPVTPRLSTALLLLKTQVWLRIPYLRDGYAFYVRWPKQHISIRQVQRIIQTASADCLGTAIHPHTLRHTFGTRVLRISNLRVTQELLGHKSITTTQIYTHPNADEKKQAIDSLQLTDKLQT